MIRERTGDIFSVPQQAIAHGVNLAGVMGEGIAKTVRKLYPDVYDEYRREVKSLRPGAALAVQSEDGTLILNLATQVEPGSNARIEFVKLAIPRMYEELEEFGCTEVAVPQIGAGIGGLDWDEVRKVIVSEANEYPHIMTDLWTYA